MYCLLPALPSYNFLPNPQPFISTMSKSNIPWTPSDERHLIDLRDTHNTSWNDIATILSRTAQGCQQHYSNLKQATASSLVTWTPEIDHAIIDGRRRGLSSKDISAELGLWALAVTERWTWLQRKHRVPEDVLALWRKKEQVVFTQDEDESIMKMFIRDMDDEQIYKVCSWKGKHSADVAKRRRQLTGEGAAGGLYAKMLGVGDEKAKNGLEKAMGKKKYDWIK
jgi:hypothetical protein